MSGTFKGACGHVATVGDLGKLCRECSDEIITGLRERVATLEARERELVKELEAIQGYKTLSEARRQILTLQSEKSLLTKAVAFLYHKWENGDPCWEEPHGGGPLGNAFRLSADEEDAILALLPKDMPRVVDLCAALSPRQPQAEATIINPKAPCHCIEYYGSHHPTECPKVKPQPPEEGR